MLESLWKAYVKDDIGGFMQLCRHDTLSKLEKVNVVLRKNVM